MRVVISLDVLKEAGLPERLENGFAGGLRNIYHVHSEGGKMASDGCAVQQESTVDRGRIGGFRGSQKQPAWHMLRHIRCDGRKRGQAGANQNTYIPSLREHTPPWAGRVKQ